MGYCFFSSYLGDLMDGACADFGSQVSLLLLLIISFSSCFKLHISLQGAVDPLL